MGVLMDFLKEDTDMKLIFLTIIVVAIFVVTTSFYSIRINNMQKEYDLKVAKLEDIERQLMAQEERLKELSKTNVLVDGDKEELEDSYSSMKTKYEILRLEKNSLAEELGSKPFSKTLCKASGNVQCIG